MLNIIRSTSIIREVVFAIAHFIAEFSWRDVKNARKCAINGESSEKGMEVHKYSNIFAPEQNIIVAKVHETP